jgi:hypothetical protein
MNENTPRNWWSIMANLLMACFVVFPAVGVAGQFSIWLGLTTFGLCSGLVGYILGKE